MACGWLVAILARIAYICCASVLPGESAASNCDTHGIHNHDGRGSAYFSNTLASLPSSSWNDSSHSTRASLRGADWLRLRTASR